LRAWTTVVHLCLCPLHKPIGCVISFPKAGTSMHCCMIRKCVELDEIRCRGSVGRFGSEIGSRLRMSCGGWLKMRMAWHSDMHMVRTSMLGVRFIHHLRHYSRNLPFGLSCPPKEAGTNRSDGHKRKMPIRFVIFDSPSPWRNSPSSSHQLNRQYMGTRSTALTTILQGLPSVRT
jgi:hypothetical protein